MTEKLSPLRPSIVARALERDGWYQVKGMLKHTVLLHRNLEEPGYSVVVPELPGCFSQGRTIEEALSNAREAIECHLEAFIPDGEEIRVEHEPLVVKTLEVEQPSWPKRKSA